MRSISFDETTLHFAVTFSPGGRHPAISHRLYKLEVEDESDEVHSFHPLKWVAELMIGRTSG